MEQINNTAPTFKTVLIHCDSRPLTFALIKPFVTSGYIIVVISKNDEVFSKNKALGSVIFCGNYRQLKSRFSKIDYLIYVSEDKVKSLEKDVKTFKRIVSKYNSKSLFLMSGFVNDGKINIPQKSMLRNVENIKLIGTLVLLGDLVSTNYKRFDLGGLQKILEKIAEGKKVKVGKDSVYYPLKIEEFTKKVKETLFSMKNYKNVVFLAGRPLNVKTLSSIFRKSIVEKKQKLKREILPYDEKIVSKRQSKRVVKKVYEFLKEDYKKHKRSCISSIKTEPLKIIENFQIIINRGLEELLRFKSWLILNRIKITITAFLFTLLLPGILILLTLFFLILTRAFFNSDYIEASGAAAKASLVISENNLKYIGFTKNIPVIDNYFRIYEKPSTLLQLESSSTDKGIKVYEICLDVFNNLYQGNNFGDESLLKQASFDLESLYQELGFLETEILGAKGLNSFMSDLLIKKEEMPTVRKKALQLKNFTDSVENIYKNDKLKNIALVFQDNSILRPTGGLIETVIISSLDDELVGKNIIYDAAQLDKKLAGNIEPPKALEKYFNEKSWFLKDANWNPDFNISAKQIEFFLERQMDVSLDGIVSIDKHFMHKLLALLNHDVSEDNFDTSFDETGEGSDYPMQVFTFPFTDSISDISESKAKIDGRNKSKILKLVYEALLEKNIQIYFDDNFLNNSALELGWGGSFAKDECGVSCYADNVSLVESTIEGDGEKLLREAQLSTSFEEGILKRTLSFYIENQNNNEYKAYLRLFVNEDVGFSPVKIIYPKKDEVVDPDILSTNDLKEAGVYFKVSPGQTMGIVFSWEGEFDGLDDSINEYKVFWKKQAGVLEYPVEISTKTLKENEFKSISDFSLTADGLFIYNTLLDRDISPSIFW